MEEQNAVNRLLSKASDQCKVFWQYIGFLSVRFAEIEQAVANSVCICLGGCDLSSGLVVTDKLQYSATLNLLEGLYPKKLKNTPYLARMKVLIPKLRSASTIRNETLHAVAMLVPSEDGEFVLEDVRYRMNNHNSKRKLTLKKLKKQTDEMLKTSNEIQRLNCEMLRHFADQ